MRMSRCGVLLVALCVICAESRRVPRTTFWDLECKGVYDVSIFARLDRVCEDCYNLFRDNSLYRMCREDCFTTEYFKGCVEALQMQNQLNEFKEYIKTVHGADPQS